MHLLLFFLCFEQTFYWRTCFIFLKQTIRAISNERTSTFYFPMCLSSTELVKEGISVESDDIHDFWVKFKSSHERRKTNSSESDEITWFSGVDISLRKEAIRWFGHNNNCNGHWERHWNWHKAWAQCRSLSMCSVWFYAVAHTRISSDGVCALCWFDGGSSAGHKHSIHGDGLSLIFHTIAIDIKRWPF